jgi:hypothetical protein
VDVTPPEVKGDFYWQPQWVGQRKHTDGKWIVSLTLASDSGFTQVTDLGSGLGKAEFTSVYLDGENAGKGYANQIPANITADGRVIIGAGSLSSLDSRYMPNGFWGEMRWDFDIYDKAGNKTRASAKVYVATKAPSTAPEPVAIYTGAATSYLGQSALQGFEAYTPGMTIYQNPVRVLYRVPCNEYYGGEGRGDIYGPWVQYLGDGLVSPSTSRILYSDPNYLYLDIQGSINGQLIDVTTTAIRGITGQTVFPFRLNVQFASEALRPPTPLKLEAYVEALGQ